MANYLTTQDVREFIQDRTIADNDLDLDLAFDDKEIERAMKQAVREYNSLPPRVHTVNIHQLPADSNIFLYGTAVHLLTSLLSKMRRNDIDYNAGGLSTNLVAKRIAHAQNEISEFRQLFREEATQNKLSINIDMGYATF